MEGKINGRIWVIIEAYDKTVKGIMAAEALRRMAKKFTIPLEVELRSNQGVLWPLSAEPASDDFCLLVGKIKENESSFLGKNPSHASISDVLKNPAEVLRSLGLAKNLRDDAASVGRRIVAVTSCPTGIAHTFMAAEGLEVAARALGMAIRIETQGSIGPGTPLTEEEIQNADLVIIAADREVDRSRFNGKMVYADGAQEAITDGKNFIQKAWDNASIQAEKIEPVKLPMTQKKGLYTHLMTGVSFMLPFVVAGGLSLALAFALGGSNAGDEKNIGTLAYALAKIGSEIGFLLMMPALAGYIAFAIAARPGLAPGMTGGLLAYQMEAGFLGCIAAGFFAGYSIYYLSHWLRLPQKLLSLKQLLFLPLLGTLLVILFMFFVLGPPLATIQAYLVNWLNSL